MDKIKHLVGIDISKNTFDVYSSQRGHAQFKNHHQGFRSFVKMLEGDFYCVMEVTGSYHHQLALFLYDQGVTVSVVNPLVIKRFIQMKLCHTKTDKSDAKMIFHYTQEQPL